MDWKVEARVSNLGSSIPTYVVGMKQRNGFKMLVTALAT